MIRGIRSRTIPALLAGLGALVITGCGSASQGQVIGSRPVANQVGNTTPTDDASAAVQAQLNADLSAADQTQSVRGENATGKETFPSDLTLMQIERLDALQKLGDAEAAKRVAAIGTLRSLIASNHILQADQLSNLLGQLDSASAGLTALKDKIDNDTLVDVCRTDVRNINQLYHVEGLLDPKIHLEAAAYEMEAAASQYQRELTNLTQAYNQAVASGEPVGNAAQLLDDVRARISNIQAAASSALSILPTLQAIDYPGNRSTLDGVHRSILAARTEVTTGATDLAGARAALPG